MLAIPNSVELTKRLCGQFRNYIKRLESLDRQGWVVGIDDGFFYTGPQEARFGGLQDAEIHETMENAEAVAAFLRTKHKRQVEVYHKAKAIDLVLGIQHQCLKDLEQLLVSETAH